jgi:hypothetical protein
MTRLYLSMSNEEWLHLAQHAYAECRTPKEQARYLLRGALGLTGNDVQTSPNANRVAVDSEAQRDAVLS